MLQLIKKLVRYVDNTEFRCYQNELEEYIKPKPIPEYILIQTGAISQGENKIVSLSRYEAPLKPESIFVSVQTERAEKLHIEIWNNLQSPSQKVFIDDLSRHEIPYIFPPTVIFPFNDIHLRPAYDVFNCIILLSPCAILDHWNLADTETTNVA